MTRDDTDYMCQEKEKVHPSATSKQKLEEKQLYGFFKRQWRNLTQEHMDMTKKGKTEEKVNLF